MVVEAAAGAVGGRAWRRGLGRQARRGGGRLVKPRWPAGAWSSHDGRRLEGAGAGGWRLAGWRWEREWKDGG